jgi:multimeric flavodoxin WrbA
MGLVLLGVSGSPRLKATQFVVDLALDYAHERWGVEVDSFSMYGKSIGFCRHCNWCVKHREGCVLEDDMTELYPKLLRADAWILASPVYQGTISGQLKTALDRCRGLVARDAHAFCNKVGAGISVGGDRSGGQEPALEVLIDFFIINEMLPVGGGSFGANLGAAVWSRDKGAAGAEEDETGLAAVRRVVDRLVEVTRLVQRGASGEVAEA